MWSHDQLANYVKELSDGEDVFIEKSLPQIEQICK